MQLLLVPLLPEPFYLCHCYCILYSLPDKFKTCGVRTLYSSYGAIASQRSWVQIPVGAKLFYKTNKISRCIINGCPAYKLNQRLTHFLEAGNSCLLASLDLSYPTRLSPPLFSLLTCGGGANMLLLIL